MGYLWTLIVILSKNTKGINKTGYKKRLLNIMVPHIYIINIPQKVVTAVILLTYYFLVNFRSPHKITNSPQILKSLITYIWKTVNSTGISVFFVRKSDFSTR